MRIYFSGIGGVGIGPLAEIALDAGYEVVGSDAANSLMTEHLASRGVTISTSQSGEFLQLSHQLSAIEWFVYTSALPDDHPELMMARKLGIRTAKRDELLAKIIKDKNLKLIAIAGTHGKTTTTAMLVWTIKQLGIPVSYSIGTTLSWGPSGQYDSASEYFVYECDEFDRNFLHFSPELSLITNIEHDHADTYPTSDDYLTAFTQFLSQSESVVIWKTDADVIRYKSDNAWVLEESDVSSARLAGAHNRRNGTLVLKALERLGIGGTQANESALEQFPGTSRRFERLAENLYSDYGHHPSEIEATLQMARELNDHVVLVYQPHQNIRQHEIRELYGDEVFQNTEAIYWLPTYLSREDPDLEVLTFSELTKRLSQSNLHNVELDDELWNDITKHRNRGSLVLCMGAGSIDSWVRQELIV